MSDKVKLTVNETPTEQVIAKANEETVVTDATGRVIKLKKPGVLAQYRLVEVVGAEAAKNEVYMGMILPLIFVSEIDGKPLQSPRSKNEVDALIQRLDEDGISAVLKGVQESFGNVDPEADKAALKN